MATKKKTQPKKTAKKAKPPSVKQTDNRRQNGQFAPGNNLGNQFQPGQSGNPAGRPKAITLSEAYRQQLAVQKAEGDESTYAEVIAKMVCEEAAKGNVMAAREIADRTEGKPKQAVEIDARLLDWRELTRANGLNEQDVINEAKRIIESAAFTGGTQSDRT